MESDPSIGMCIHYYARRARPASFATGTTSLGSSLDVLPFAPPSSPELAILDGPPGSGGSANTPPAHHLNTPVSFYGTLVSNMIKCKHHQINAMPHSQPAKEVSALIIRAGAPTTCEAANVARPEGSSGAQSFYAADTP